MVYGVHGIGKSTFGASAPRPIFIQTEDGIGDIDCDRLPLCDSLEMFYDQLGSVISEDHDYQTLVIDSADWLENLISAAVCKRAGKKALTDFEFGKGNGLVVAEWGTVLEGLQHAVNRGLMVILLAHSEVTTFNDPLSNSYDRYSPKLLKKSSALIQEWCDEVLFVGEEFSTKVLDEGFNQTRVIGIGEVRRVMYTTEQPGAYAKNRLDGLPDKIDFIFVFVDVSSSWVAISDSKITEYEEGEVAM
jgi:hypothetical protein